MTKTIYQLISDVQHDICKAGLDKSQRNEHGRYNFRGIDDLYNMLAPILGGNGLTIIPSVLKAEHKQMQTSGGKSTNHWTVWVEYTLIGGGAEGEHKTTFVGEAYDTSDKGLNKALTAAYKYLCFELFCIPIEGSDDADADNHQVEAVEPMSDDQRREILGLCMQTNTEVDKFVAFMGYESMVAIPATEHDRAVKSLNKKLEAMSQQYAAEQDVTNQSMNEES